MESYLYVVTAVIAAIPSIVLVIVQSKGRKAETNKTITDTNKTITDTYHTLAEDLRLEINRLSFKINEIEVEKEKEIAELRNLLSNLQLVLKTYVEIECDLRKGVLVLRKQLINNDSIPLYELPNKISFDIEYKEN